MCGTHARLGQLLNDLLRLSVVLQTALFQMNYRVVLKLVKFASRFGGSHLIFVCRKFLIETFEYY